MKNALLLGAVLLASAIPAASQVNSGSNGSDGAFNPTQDVEIDMADHPDGIYHYTSVNIPSGVTVTFKPNAANTPVVWLVQGDVLVTGSISANGQNINGAERGKAGAPGGPGGFAGGHAPLNDSDFAGVGLGPGGGKVVASNGIYICGSNGSYGQIGGQDVGYQQPPGEIYGNQYLLPIFGGSGGSGGYSYGYRNGGGGGGGAILIASGGVIQVEGSINAVGGGALQLANGDEMGGGGGSGGGIRLVASKIFGRGNINVSGAWSRNYTGWGYRGSQAGRGRIRFDTFDNSFGGPLTGEFSHGFQPVILPAQAEGIQLNVASIAGVQVLNSPSGVLANPDVIIPAQQANPIPVTVSCTNIPLNSEISVIVHPSNGPDVQAVGLNNVGTLATSTATVSVNMPRGGGIIYAKCVSGLSGLGADNSSKDLRTKSLAQTGWTADGERFAKVEVTASLGGQQHLAYITESGRRYALAAR